MGELVAIIYCFYKFLSDFGYVYIPPRPPAKPRTILGSDYFFRLKSSKIKNLKYLIVL